MDKIQKSLDKKNGLGQLFWMLGIAITLPMVLLSGPLAGFLISQWVIKKWNFPPESTIILVLLGLLGSAIQTVRLLRRLYRRSEQS